jgi:hypothetical protein
VEDQERTDQTPEEEQDVEGHKHKDQTSARNDEGDDVEGHVLVGKHKDKHKD